MNVAKLMIVADEAAFNYRAGQVIAERSSNEPGDWLDPFGGEFDEREQEEFDQVASGRQSHAALRGVSGFYARRVPCRLTVDF